MWSPPSQHQLTGGSFAAGSGVAILGRQRNKRAPRQEEYSPSPYRWAAAPYFPHPTNASQRTISSAFSGRERPECDQRIPNQPPHRLNREEDNIVIYQYTN